MKHFPAYGRRLLQLRQQGRIPNKLLMVVFNWMIARAYPRIVIPNNTQLAELEFSYLAGLPVQIIHSKDACRADAVAREILKVNPCFLATFDLGLVETGKARLLIKPYEKILDKERA